MANYAYDLAKEFNQYYHDTQILKESDDAVRSARLALIKSVSEVLAATMALLGIELPERM
jgi:arginyl-tRNA synthetase